MKPTVLMDVDGKLICDIVAVPSYGACRDLCRYFEKYWQADIEELFDTGFAAKFKVSMPGRYFILSHDSQIGNSLSAPDRNIDSVIPDILSDLNKRLGQD